jgi:hypothetical protein
MRKRIDTPTTILNKPDTDSVERAIKIAKAQPDRPEVLLQHRVAEQFQSGLPVPVSIVVLSKTPYRIVMHYRHVNQAERWQSVELRKSGDKYQGEIPADYTSRRFALQYYFEVVTGTTEATLFPPLASDLSNVPYFVVRRSGSNYR